MFKTIKIALLSFVCALMSLSTYAQQDINFYSNRAEEKINLKDYNGALEDFKTVLGMAQKAGDKSAVANAYNRRSLVFSFMKDYKNAIAELEKAVVADKQNTTAYLDAMATHAKNGLKDYGLSLNYLNRAIAFNKENGIAEDGSIYYERGRLKIEKLDSKEDGCADLKKAIKILAVSNPALLIHPQRYLDKYCK